MNVDDAIQGMQGADPGTVPATRVEVASYRWTHWSRIEAQWREVFIRSHQRSGVLAPEWVATWLETFGQQLQPEVLIFSEAGTPVGCCLLVRRDMKVGG